MFLKHTLLSMCLYFDNLLLVNVLLDICANQSQRVPGTTMKKNYEIGTLEFKKKI